MKVKHIGLSVVVLITVAIIGYKMNLAAATTQTVSQTKKPRVLLVANLAEANETEDACADIIHLVRAAHKRGVAVEEVDANSKSPLLAQYHVLVIPTVLIFDRHGKEIYRLQGEGGNVVQQLRSDLARIK